MVNLLSCVWLLPSSDDTKNVMLARLFEQAKAGNEAARIIFRRAGRFLALGLANVVNIFDPSLIILAGERMQYDYLYADDVMREMHQLALNRPEDAPQQVEIQIGLRNGAR